MSIARLRSRLFLLLLLGAVPLHAQESRDALQKIVQNCIAPAGNRDDCPAPRVDRDDLADPECRRTTYVWTETAAYVAVRDREECGCPPGFVHGLALPFAYFPGIEADDLPEGIWPFAWEAAREHIGDESAIALVVNSPWQRTQDYLHIHLVRLRDGAPRELGTGLTASVATLEHVWDIGRSIARASHLADYGLLVVRGESGGFTVRVQGGWPRDSAEKAFTVFRCR